MSLDVSRIKAIFFDVDGTLSDTDNLYSQRISRLMPRFLFPDADQAARRLVMWLEAPGNALLSFADRINLDDPMAALVEWYFRHRRQPRRGFLLISGVDEMLSQLSRSYHLAVVSTRDAGAVMSFLEQFDLVKHFEAIISGQSARHTKPYPDPILLAAQKLGIPPENCVMIGDTTVDILAGKAAGTQTIGVLCGFGEEAELRRLGADEIVSATPDVVDLLIPNSK